MPKKPSGDAMRCVRQDLTVPAKRELDHACPYIYANLVPTWQLFLLTTMVSLSNFHHGETLLPPTDPLFTIDGRKVWREELI